MLTAVDDDDAISFQTASAIALGIHVQGYRVYGGGIGSRLRGLWLFGREEWDLRILCGD